MQIDDLDDKDLGGLEFRPKDPSAPLPNVEAEGSQAPSAKKRKAAPGTTTSAGKKKPKISSSKSTKDLEKKKSKTLRQAKLSFSKGDDSSSALENVVILER